MTTKISSDNIQAATLATLGSGPTVTNVQITDSSYNVLDDTAVGTSGGYIKITGTNFASGCSVIINSTNATSVTFVSSTVLNVQVPAMAAGTYIVYVVNTDGGIAIRVNGLTYSSEPTWVTGSSLTGDSGIPISIQLTATDATVYTLQAGSTLPANLTLNSGGLLSGTVTIDNETLYNFTVVATDAEFQDSPRTFSITITAGDIYFAATTLLLSGSADTFVRDASANNFPVTVVGDTKPNNFNPYLTGWSNYFDGTGDYLTLPANNGAFAFGTGDFTIEMWVNPDTVAPNYQQLAGASYSTAGGSLYLATNTVTFYTNTTNAQTPAASIKTGTWQHIAAVRASGVLKIYINGVQSSSAAFTANLTTTDGRIGTNPTSPTTELYKGYISNLRVIKGTALYSDNFTPSTTPLAAVSNTSLLTCQSNLFVDNSTNNFALTRSGDVKIQSFSPFVEPATTNGSGYFDGNGDYLTVSDNAAFDFTGDFTMEAWVYPTVIGANNAIAAQWVIGGLAFLYKVITNGRLQFVSFPGTSVTVTATTTTVELNQWSHVAVTRSGTTVRLFVNGVMDATTGTVSGTLASTTPLTIGTVGAETVQYWNGYLSNLRIVKGTAVYTANFTPSTSPLTAVSGTSLLTLQTDIPQTNSQFLDSGSNNSVVTRVGNTTQGTFSPYSPSGWSSYFDGNNNYLTPATNAAFTMGTVDFTYECWVNRQGVNPVSSSFAITVFDTRTAEPSIAPCLFWENNAMRYYVNGANRIVSTSTFPIGTWAHVAIVRSSGVTKMYVNGVQEGDSYTDTNNYVGTVTNIGGRFAAVSGDFRSWFGYISNVRIVKGTAVYTSNFAPSTQPLTAISDTVLLTCADNRFVDDSPNNFAITRTGDVRVANFSPFKAVVQTPVSYSTYFDGTGDYLSATDASFGYGTGDVTIECWIYRVQNGRNDGIYTGGRTPTASGGFGIKISSTNKVAWNTNTFYGEGTTTVLAGQWYHIAITRYSGVLKWYINGVLDYTSAFTQNCTNPFCNIGITDDPLYTNMYISNFRLVTNSQIYTGNFTPPTSPLTAIPGTRLLTCQSPTFVDNSTNKFAITAFGNSQPTTVNPFGFTFTNSQGYTVAEYGGSMYFDGTGDYLEMPANTIFDFGANNFTMECWVFPLTTGVATGFISNWQTGGQFNFRKSTANRLQFQYDPVSVASVIVTGTTTTIVTGMWNHIAVVRNGSLYTLYVNGVADATTSTSAAALEVLGKPLRIGVDGDVTNPMNGYISDVRIIKGQALYTGNFVPPLAPMLPVQNTTVLLNGTSAGIVDATTKNVLETVGDAKISTAVAKFGGSSMYFDGTGDYLSIPNNINLYVGAGDFTYECWVYPTVGSGTMGLISKRVNSTGGYSGANIELSGLNPRILISTNGTSWASTSTSSISVTQNAWNHVAMTRLDTTVTVWVNGISGLVTTISGTVFTGTANMTIGARAIDGTGLLTGYMQDVRITKGIARYTANFTPPTSPFTTK